jgi:hypothetical protein
MSGNNGENGFRPIGINVTNEHEFKVGVATHLQLLVDRTRELPDIKKKVDKHEQVYQSGKWLALPLLTLIHVLIKGLFHKLGWWQ